MKMYDKNQDEFVERYDEHVRFLTLDSIINSVGRVSVNKGKLFTKIALGKESYKQLKYIAVATAETKEEQDEIKNSSISFVFGIKIVMDPNFDYGWYPVEETK